MKTDVVILTRNPALFGKCMDSLQKWSIQHVDKVLVGYTGTSDDERREIENGLRYAWKPDGNSVVKRFVYNFASNVDDLINDYAASDAVLLLNDDVELTEDAIGPCLEVVENMSVGTVGIRLVYPDETIQHAGIFTKVVNGQFGGVGHVLHHAPDRQLKPLVTHGNTGAFLMTRLQTWKRLGGLDRNFQHCFEDVCYCWDVMAAGLMNITMANIKAYHLESATRKQAISAADIQRLKDHFEQVKDRIEW